MTKKLASRTYLIIASVIAFTTALGFLSFPSKIQACEPEEPDYWYLENIEISIDAILPWIVIGPGKYERTIQISNQSPNPHNVWLLTYKIQNTLSQEGNYVTGNIIADRFDNESLPLRLKKEYILSLLDEAIFYLYGEGTGSIELSPEDFESGSINDFVYPDYQDFNVAADGLVGEPDPLPPQTLNFALNVEGILQLIPFTIHYTSNPEYDPHKYGKSVYACGQQERSSQLTATAQFTNTNLQPSRTSVVTPVAGQQVFQPSDEPVLFSFLSSPLIWIWLIPLTGTVIFLRFRRKST